MKLQVNRKGHIGAIAVYLTTLIAVGATYSAAQVPLQISLEQRFGRALFRSCELNVQIVERMGRSTLRCIYNVDPVAALAADRALTSQETERLLSLMAARDISSGTATGKDFTSTDGVRETVSIQRGADLTVIVASGNPSFDAGSRRQLLSLLHSLLEDLRRRAEAK